MLLGATIHPAGIWFIAPIDPRQASYSGILLLAGIVGVVGITFLLVRMLAHGRMRRVPAWDCGYPHQTARMQDTAEGFGQPIRHMFGAFFRMERDLPTPTDNPPRYRMKIEDRIWRALYLPIARATQRTADAVSVLQSGSLSIYLLCSFLTLILLLVFVL
jgi:hydrogenase-4 component B